MRLGIFSSSKDLLKNKYYKEINELLLKLNDNDNIDKVVYGGGKIGIMGMVHNIFMPSNKIISHNLKKWQEYPEENIYDNMFDRQRAIIEDSDCFLVLPGGVGTLSELFDCMMLNDTESCKKNVIIFNCDGYYTELYQYIEKLHNMGSTKKSDMLFISDNINDIINYINTNL